MSMRAEIFYEKVAFTPAPKLDEFVENELINDYELTEEEQIAIVSKYEKRPKRRSRVILGCTAVSLAFTTLVNGYMSDVYANEALESKNDVSLQTIQPLDGDSSIFFTDGFNTRDGHFLGRKLGPAVQQVNNGSIESVSFGDAAPDPQDIADQVIEYATSHNRTHVSLFGYSLGGFESLKAAAKIIKDSDIQIDAIYLASTPYDLNSLQDETRTQLNVLTSVLAHIPFSEHSTYVKFLITLGFHKDDFMPGGDFFDSLSHFDMESFFKSWDDSAKAVQDHEGPNLSALQYQLDLARTNLRDTIKQISDSNEVMPTIVYLKIAKPGFDNTVKNNEASDHICNDAENDQIPCIILSVRGSQHAEYYTDQSVSAYEEALAKAKADILESQRRQQEIYTTRNWVFDPNVSDMLDASGRRSVDVPLDNGQK